MDCEADARSRRDRAADSAVSSPQRGEPAPPVELRPTGAWGRREARAQRARRPRRRRARRRRGCRRAWGDRRGGVRDPGLTHVGGRWPRRCGRRERLVILDALLEENIGEPPSQRLGSFDLFTAVDDDAGGCCSRSAGAHADARRRRRVPPGCAAPRPHAAATASLANNEIGRATRRRQGVHTLFLQKAREVIERIVDLAALQTAHAPLDHRRLRPRFGDVERRRRRGCPTRALAAGQAHGGEPPRRRPLTPRQPQRARDTPPSEISSVDELERSGLGWSKARLMSFEEFDIVCHGAARELVTTAFVCPERVQQVQLLDGTAVAERTTPHADDDHAAAAAPSTAPSSGSAAAAARRLRSLRLLGEARASHRPRPRLRSSSAPRSSADSRRTGRGG